MRNTEIPETMQGKYLYQDETTSSKEFENEKRNNNCIKHLYTMCGFSKRSMALSRDISIMLFDYKHIYALPMAYQK